MNNKIILLATFFSSLVICPALVAAEVEVEWTEPDKYRDIRAGEENKKHFQAKTFYNFEKHFAKLAEKLPSDQVLKINVTDVDLAGSTMHGGMSRVRIIKEVDFPRLKFSYQLIDKSEDRTISTNEVNLKNMGFMQHASSKYRNKALMYEKRMLDKWFHKTFM